VVLLLGLKQSWLLILAFEYSLELMDKHSRMLAACSQNYLTCWKCFTAFSGNGSNTHTHCITIPMLVFLTRNYANKTLLYHSLVTNASCEMGHMILMSTWVFVLALLIMGSHGTLAACVWDLLYSMYSVTQHGYYCISRKFGEVNIWRFLNQLHLVNNYY